MLLRIKKKIKILKCWKCTMLFCIILNLLQSNQADLFGSYGISAHPVHPTAYGPVRGKRKR